MRASYKTQQEQHQQQQQQVIISRDYVFDMVERATITNN